MGMADQFLQEAGAPQKVTSASAQFAGDVAVQPVVARPEQGRGALAQGRDALNALTHHVLKLPRGIDQGVTNLVGSAASLLPDNPVSRALMESAAHKNEYVKQNEQNYQAVTPNSAGAYVGATAGEVLPFLVGGTARGLQKAGDFVGGKAASLLPSVLERAAPMTAKVVSAGTQGAILGAAQPVTNASPGGVSSLVTGDAEPTYWQQKARDVLGSTAIGASIPIATTLLGKALTGIKNAAAPILAPKSVVAPKLTDWLTQGGKEELGAVVDKLRASQEIVTGSVPTTAQVAANPSIVAAEKVLSGNPAYKPKFDARAIVNNDARIAAVQDVAKTPDALAAALQARKDATGGAIEAILNNGKPVDAAPVIAKLEALKRSPLGVRPTISGAASDILKVLEERGKANPVTGEVFVHPGDLDALRQNVKDYLSKHATNGVVGSQQEAAFEPVRNAIIDSVEGANQGYRAYLEAYAKHSTPINTMEAAGRILDNVAGSGRGANASGAAQVTLPGYSSALAGALKKAPYGIDPAAEATLKAVQSDLQRASISNSLRVPGSDTSYNLQAPGWLSKQLYGENFSGSPTSAKVVGGVFGALGGHLSGGGPYGIGSGAAAGAMAMNKLGQIGQAKVNDVLAEALLNPQFAADLAARQLPKQAGPTKAAAAALLANKAPQINLLLQNLLQQKAPQAVEALQQPR